MNEEDLVELYLGTIVELGAGLGERWIVQDRRRGTHGWWYTFRCLGDSGTREGYFVPGGGSGHVISEPADG